LTHLNLWTRQKRLQGSHFCAFVGIKQLQKIVEDQKIDCRASKIFEWEDLSLAHEQLYEVTATFGNCSILVQATYLVGKVCVKPYRFVKLNSDPLLVGGFNPFSY
jgi:hypothetical protein